MVGIAPGLVGVVVVVIGAAAIGVGDGLLCLAFFHMFCFDDAFYA